MNRNKIIEEFFDCIADKWDEREVLSLEFKIELLKKLEIKLNDKVLDLGCGTGVITPLILKFSQSRVDAMDLSPKMIKIAKTKFKDNKNLNFFVGDVYDYKFNSSYDYIVIYNAYPHFLDVIALAKKLSSILNMDGKLAIIHSISKERLNIHHNKISSSIKRNLEDVYKESLLFKDYFFL